MIEINVSVFPNPSSGVINIKTNLEFNDIKLYGIDGKLIDSIVSRSIKIKTKGVYFIKIITDKGVFYKKIIVQ